MCTKNYFANIGTKMILQPNGAFLWNKNLNRFEVVNQTGKEVLLKALSRRFCPHNIVEEMAEEYEISDSDAVLNDITGYLDVLKASSFITGIPSAVSSDDFIQLEDLEEKLKMVHAVVDITNRCNLSCLYCYAESNSHIKELEGKGWIDLLKKHYNYGLRAVVLSGGEPLCHPDFWLIIDFCAEHFITELNTNGILISADVAKNLATKNLKRVQVSLDSWNPSLHDAYRGKNSWEKAMAGISFLQKEKIPLRISMTVRAETVGEIPELEEFCRKNDFELMLLGLKNAGRARNLPSTLENFPRSLLSSDFEDCERFQVRCAGMVGFAGINCDGRLKACNMAPSFFQRIGGGIEEEKNPKIYHETDIGRDFLATESRIKDVDESSSNLKLEFPSCILERYYRFRGK